MLRSHRRCVSIILFLFPALTYLSATCIDSIHYRIKPVQCNGLRNGELRIDTVYGSSGPFYFSIDGQTFSTNPHFDQLWAGDYTLYVRDGSGCISQQNIMVPEPEELKVYLSATDSLVVVGEPVELRAEVLPAGSQIREIEWRPPLLFAGQDSLRQLVHPAETTTFAIEIRNLSDCYARAQLTVEVENPNLFFPNALRPGSDQNAWFTVFAGDGVSRIAGLQVWNRSGGLVFERHDFAPNDPLKGWNGRWRSRPVPPGIYPWTAEIEFLDGKIRQFSGALTVVR